jgi:transcriptional regulator with XRE-family HTH domain
LGDARDGGPRPATTATARSASLAQKTGIDQGDISRIERGAIFPNEKTLLRLADALGAEWRMVDKATA